MNNMMLPMLLMSKMQEGNGSNKMTDMLPLLMMTGGMGNDLTSNPLMLMAMMGDGNMEEMLPLMLMSGGMGNTANGSNPMANMMPFFMMQALNK